MANDFHTMTLEYKDAVDRINCRQPYRISLVSPASGKRSMISLYSSSSLHIVDMVIIDQKAHYHLLLVLVNVNLVC